MRKAIPDGRPELWSNFKRTQCRTLRNQLVEHYLPLVRTVADRVSSRLPKFVDPDDLMSAGIFGLLKAIENFDPERGTKFETYCRLRVKGSMLDELRSQDWIPREARNREARLLNAVSELKNGLGREPSDIEIASSLNISINELKDIILHVTISNIISLNVSEIDQYTGNGVDQMSRMPLFEAEPSEIAHRNEIVDLIYGNLAQIEKMIIMFYYHEGLTMKEIGEVLQISESRVCQIHA
ncbi:MAG: FliA/WhiG family RNA polymerase sigma factor, partial [Planctomycetota bacterium]